MKVFIRGNGITITGKAWQIKEKLKSCSKKYRYVAEWLHAMKERR